MSDIEFAILDFIQDNFRTDFSNFIMPLISALGNKGIIWIITGLILCILKKVQKIGNNYTDCPCIFSTFM